MRKIISVILIIISFTFVLASSDNNKPKEAYKVKVEWKNKLNGNYSFREEWGYGENICRDAHGQFREFDNPIAENMLDAKGRIYKDSISKYYQYVDTSHIYYSIECEANCYEWAKSNYIIARKYKNTVKCYTLCDISTHSSLEIVIANDSCIPQIVLNSVTNRGVIYYKCNGGYIKIDSLLWKKGIMKAEFSFTFDDPENPKKSLWWKGKIYTKIYEKDKTNI